MSTAASSPLKYKYEEVMKCGQDPIYFITKYLSVQHPVKGRLPFNLFPFQKDCINDFLKYRHNVIVKSRQLGLSETVSAYCLWLALFHRDKNVVLMATTLKTAGLMVRKIREKFKMLPEWMTKILNVTEPEANSKNQLSLSNGSSIKAVPTTDGAVRGEAGSIIVVDEAAFIENFQDLWKAIWPTLSEGGSSIIFSTPNGKNYFHEIFTGAEKTKTGETITDVINQSGNHKSEVGGNGFHAIKLPWTVHPERDDKWFEAQSAGMDAKGIAQEFLCVGPNTKIITKDGFKLASEISVGDYAYTHNGRFKKIININRRSLKKEENLYEISLPNNRQSKILVTGNHPALVYNLHIKKGSTPWETFNEISHMEKPKFEDFDKNFNFVKRTNKKSFACLQPCLSLQTINNNIVDFVKYKIHTKSDDNFISYYRQKNPTKRFIELNENTGIFLGLYASEGCINNAKSENIQFSFNSSEKDLIEFIENFCKNLNIDYSINVRDYGHCTTIIIYNKFIINLIDDFFTREDATKKHLKMDRFLSESKEFIRGYLIGHFKGNRDHFEAQQKHNKANKLKVVCESPKMLYQLRTLLSAFNLYPRIGNWYNKEVYLEFNGLNQNNLSSIEELLKHGQNILTNENSKTKFIENLQAFYGLYQIKKVDNSIIPYVYDIEVEDDHSFVAQGIVLHNCNFESSGTTYFGIDDIGWIKDNIINPVGFSGPKGKGNDLWIWKTAVNNHKYIICADIARGDAEDFSAFHIIDTNEHEIVAEYMGKIPPDRYGEFLAEIGNKYNNALVIFEKNTFGHSVGIRMRDIKYDNVYFDEEIKEQMIYADPEEKNDLMAHSGFTIKPNNREKVISKLEETIRNKKLRIYSSRFLQQMEYFIWTGKRAQAIKRKNDDLIISLAIGLQIYDPSGGYSETTNTDGMAWQMAFLASLQRTGVSKGSMETGINSFGSRANNNPLMPMATRNQNSTLNPIRSFNTSQEPNKFLGKKLAPGVDPEKVAQDYMWRTEFDWLLK